MRETGSPRIAQAKQAAAIASKKITSRGGKESRIRNAGADDRKMPKE
jgi:hypothetical protein